MTKLFSLIASALTCYGVILPSDRQITWRPGMENGIPSVTTVFTNFTASATAAQIQGAINNCPSNQVIKLADGNYTLSAALKFDTSKGVVLRGSSSNTFLKFTSGGTEGDIGMTGAAGYPGSLPETSFNANWTAGYAQGSSNLTFSSVSGLQNDYLVTLYQDNDYYVNGDGSEGGSLGSRAQVQVSRVTGIAGSVVTIARPLHMPNWASGKNPKAVFNRLGFGNIVTMCGVENLSVTNTGGNLYNFYFANAHNCWLSNVYSYNSQQAHVKGYFCSSIEVRHSYFYGTIDAASQSYGVNWFCSSDCLAEDNIFNHVTSPYAGGPGAVANVYDYNYCTNFFYTANTNWLIEGYATHAGHCDHELFESNVGTSFWSDFIHGSASHLVLLRNIFTGWETNKTQNTMVVALQSTNQFISFVGNILGKPGYHDFYETTLASGASKDGTSIYELGFKDTTTTAPGYDTDVKATLIRWGNYDTVNTTNIWTTNNVVDPTDKVIPSSYLYGAKPAFFHSLAWPPFDASSGATIASAGSVYGTNLPAGYRFVFGSDPPDGSPQAAFSSGMSGTAALSGNAVLR